VEKVTLQHAHLFHSNLKPSIDLRIPPLHDELFGAETNGVTSSQAHGSFAIQIQFRECASKTKKEVSK